MNDARPLAYIAAWSRLQAVEQINCRPTFASYDVSALDAAVVEQQRAQEIAQLMAEAELYTRLINVPLEVALCAGEWIEEDRKRREDQEDHIYDALFGSPEPKTVHCYGCGEKIPAAKAYADGPRAFHFNDEGGGHTCEADAYTDDERHNP
jgi:hypothetical protein